MGKSISLNYKLGVQETNNYTHVFNYSKCICHYKYLHKFIMFQVDSSKQRNNGRDIEIKNNCNLWDTQYLYVWRDMKKEKNSYTEIMTVAYKFLTCQHNFLQPFKKDRKMKPK